MAKNITEKSNVRVQWYDKFENHSREKEQEIIKYIKHKYKPKGVVRVDFLATNKLNIGVSNLETGDVENINTPEVQERIILSWLKDNHIDITLDDIRRLNKRVEAALVDFNETKDNKWKIKNLTLENFLSYGNETKFDFEKLKGLTLIQGRNFAGKTTVVEALLFLLFNTTTKTKIADDVINKYNGATFAKVEGELTIDGVDYKIVREVKRQFKKDGTYTKTTTDLKFMTKNSAGEYEEPDKDEDRRATDKKIKENIGSLNEFLMTVVCTGSNIFGMIEADPADRGMLLSRFLGLEIFEKKEEVAKKMYNEWKLKSKIDKYSSSDLQAIIDENNSLILANLEAVGELKIELADILEQKQKYSREKDELGSLYHNDIDTSMNNMTEDDFKRKITAVELEITNKTAELNRIKETYLSDVEKFDEETYNQNKSEISGIENGTIKSHELDIQGIDNKIRSLENSNKDIEGDNKVLNNELVTLRATVLQLKNGTSCPECGQKLENVDHTDIINLRTEEGKTKRAKLDGNLIIIEENKVKIEEQQKEKSAVNLLIFNLREKVKSLSEVNDKLLLIKDKIVANDMLGLRIDKTTVEIEVLGTKKQREEDNYKRYLADLSKIQRNIELDELIRLKNIEVLGQEERERTKNREITSYETNNEVLLKGIEENEILIDTIKKEEHINKIFLVYLNMVGKNGISKTIMKNSIPVLNMELAKFLRDSAEFTVEIEINEKNNKVEFWLIDNGTGNKAPMIAGSGYEKTIGALAIRIVNSKINALPKPSLLLVDEIFSTVDVENLELIKLFMDKVSSNIDNVFMITHNELVKEWADNIVTVTKVNNISTVLF